MHDLSVFFAITFVTVLTPGAGVLFTISSALRGGIRSAWQAPLGNVLGFFVIALLCAVGLGAVLTTSPVLFTALQVASAIVLLYLGWRAWHSPAKSFQSLRDGKIESEPGPKPRGGSLFLSAFLLQLTNPMLFVYLVSLLPQFVAPEDPYVERMAVLLAIFAGTGIVIHFAYSYSAAWARRFLSGPKASSIMNRVSGALFIFFGGSVLVKAVAAQMA